MLGTTEIIIILAIALLVFGPTKLPEIGRQIGAAMRELRKMSSDVQRALDIDDITRYDPPSYGSTYQYNGTTDYNPDKAKSYDSNGYETQDTDDDPNNSDYPYISEPAALASANGAASDTELTDTGEEADAAAPFVEPPGPRTEPVSAAREAASVTTTAAAAGDKE